MALQPFNSVSGFSVGETPTVIISNTGNVSGNTANFSGNLTALNANLGNLTLSNNFTGNFINGNSNIVIVANGAIELGVMSLGEELGFLTVFLHCFAGNACSSTVMVPYDIQPSELTR